ncbi:hypothetical protein [Escherichia coli]|uniref:hypothetical protein n=1 Tax=Escherichia coli TaxID=562 RepID=UPI002B231D47|nr:hypothetical protein [Escherichia coli]
MKSLIADVIGLTGFGLLTCGVYLQFGMAPALILSGALLLVGALVMVRRPEQQPKPAR